MAKIILSYRRADSDLVAGRMHDRLVKQYGNDAVFIDVDNIPVGQDYRQHIKDALLQSDAIIVIVGSKWLGGSRKGQARIHDADDPVRVEVETALQNGIPIVPVLIGGAKMPNAAQLPESVRKFSYINALSITPCPSIPGEISTKVWSG